MDDFLSEDVFLNLGAYGSLFEVSGLDCRVDITGNVFLVEFFQYHGGMFYSSIILVAL